MARTRKPFVRLGAWILGGAVVGVSASAWAEEPAGAPGTMEIIPVQAPAPATAVPPPAPSSEGRPGVLERVIEGPVQELPPAPPPKEPASKEPVGTTPLPPLGYTGPSSVAPRDVQTDPHFLPVEDRWRVGFPEWDRYGWDHPKGIDYPYSEGHWYDPYNQNVLKGDYPIIGQNTFLIIDAISLTEVEYRQTPIPTTPFESTFRPAQFDFYGRPNQFAVQQYFTLSFDLNHGDGVFKPADWKIKVTPIFNLNYLAVDELAVVNPDVTKGTDRGRSWTTLQEYFAETKITDLSPDYDFLSVRVGSQPFTSDFRGFIFSDTNRAVRLFGTELVNRVQFNLVYFDMLEKDTDSGLNRFNDRHQDVVIGNVYYQDFILPGYTVEASVHYDHDKPSFHFDRDNNLVRPDPAGVFTPHDINVAWLGLTGDGHLGRYNITNAFYWALGRDSKNPIANTAQDINAQMAAVELSYDRDWARFRTSFLWASGDENPRNSHATGFDSILDNTNFAGGGFSYFQRQAIGLFGVHLVQEQSLFNDLRSSKIEGQANFVNPGTVLVNLGADFDLTPKLRSINNVNYLWFDHTEVLSQFFYEAHVRHAIGADLSSGIEYRPLLSNNIILNAGVSSLIPDAGFRDLYNKFRHPVGPLMAAFMELIVAF